VQGGSGGVKLICLTPPVEIRLAGTAQRARCEVYWDKNCLSGCFLKYSEAPVVTDIEGISTMLRGVDRSTEQAKLASKFRSQTKPLPLHVAKALLKHHAKATRDRRRHAVGYEQTLPTFDPRAIEAPVARKK
jgi:hypothetical protein